MNKLAHAISRDPWVAASLMQKAVRRGMGDVAEVAAHALFRLRGRAVWRRLVVVAVEDVGIGDVNSVVRTVELAGNSGARLALGSETDALSVAVRMLAACPKDRSSDYLICSAIGRTDLEPTRERCGTLGPTALHDDVRNEELTLAQRAVALWYGSGVNVGDEPRLSAVPPRSLHAIFGDTDVPTSLIAAAEEAARILRHPISVMLPLIWLAAQGGRTWKVEKLSVPDPGVTPSGIPLFAFDKHTSRGKAAIGLFAKRCVPVREILAEFVPEFRARDAACMAAYYADAAPIARRLVWSQSEALHDLGLDTDLRKSGVCQTGVRAVFEVVAANLDMLNAIRADLGR